MTIYTNNILPSFLYGGWDGTFNADTNFDSFNVYILTLPAFVWILAPINTSRSQSFASHRAGSSCQVVGRQMISVGGWDPTSTEEFSPPDPWQYGIGVLDMTALTWNMSFQPSAEEYLQPDVVNSYYAEK